jgi:hypothetical protein
MNTWLENLKKAQYPAAAAPAAVLEKRAKGLNVPAEFADLLRVDDGDADVAGIAVSQTFDTDAPTCDVPDPVAGLVKALSDERNRIPEFAPTETPHADGEEVEITGSATWTRTYAKGELVKSMTNDPALPGRRMFFDSRGYEISRAEYQAIDKAVAPDLAIETSLAKILGVAPGDQCPEEGV